MGMSPLKLREMSIYDTISLLETRFKYTYPVAITELSLASCIEDSSKVIKRTRPYLSASIEDENRRRLGGDKQIVAEHICTHEDAQRLVSLNEQRDRNSVTGFESEL